MTSANRRVFRVVKGDLKEWGASAKIRCDEQHPEYLGSVMTDRNRWEYQKVVDKQSMSELSNSTARKNGLFWNESIMKSAIPKMDKKEGTFRDSQAARRKMKRKHPDAHTLVPG